MSLTAISLFESATGKIFINATPKVRSNKRQENFSSTQRCQQMNQTFLCSGAQNECNGQKLDRIGEKTIFHELTYIMSRKKESNVFGLRRPK